MSKRNKVFEEFFDDIRDDDIELDNDVEVDKVKRDVKLAMFYPLITPKQTEINEIQSKLNFLIKMNQFMNNATEVKLDQTKFTKWFETEFDINEKKFKYFIYFVFYVFTKKIPKESVLLRVLDEDETYDLTPSNVGSYGNKSDSYHAQRIKEFVYRLMPDRSYLPYYKFIHTFYNMDERNDFIIHFPNDNKYNNFYTSLLEDKKIIDFERDLSYQPDFIFGYEAAVYDCHFIYDSDKDAYFDMLKQLNGREYVPYIRANEHEFNIVLAVLKPVVINNVEVFVYLKYTSTFPYSMSNFAPKFKIIEDLFGEETTKKLFNKPFDIKKKYKLEYDDIKGYLNEIENKLNI